MKNIQTYTLLLQKRILGFYYILNENCNCSIFTYISQCSIFHFNVFFFSFWSKKCNKCISSTKISTWCEKDCL